MSFTPLPSFTKDVSMLADTVTLTASQLKAQFDAAPSELLTSFNNLITALKQTTSGDSGAKNLGATAITGLTGTDVQTILEALNTNLNKRVTANGESITVVEPSFFTNGTVNFLSLTVNFPTTYTSPPTVLPGPVTQSIGYSDFMAYPFITNIGTTSFTVKLSTANPSNNFGSGTLKMKFLVFGK